MLCSVLYACCTGSRIGHLQRSKNSYNSEQCLEEVKFNFTEFQCFRDGNEREIE